MTDHPSSLTDHLAFLALTDCRCEWGWRALGRLYGVSFGKGWVRMTTDPQCKHHQPRETT